MEVKTFSPAQTKKIAQKLSSQLKGGDILALYGDLGSGKTIFAQGIAKGLGIKKRILSPTFVFMRTYPFVKKGQELTFYHIDLYRGEDIKDFRALGLDEIFNDDAIILLEWAEKISSALPKKRFDIYLKKIDDKTRKISINKK